LGDQNIENFVKSFLWPIRTIFDCNNLTATLDLDKELIF